MRVSMKVKNILMVMVMLMVCNGISAQKKIVVVSDPHVMAPELLVNKGKAWTDYLNGQRKMVDYSQPLFDEMIARIKTAKPDLVLITGDLTKDGEQLSHQYVISKLDELRDLGIKTLVIPGNHDRWASGNAVYYDGDETRKADTADNSWFAEQYANYGYGEGSEREPNTLTYACEPIDGLVVIGIDSGTDGSWSETTLDWITTLASTARKNGKQVIAMMHHPLLPHFTGVENFVETTAVTDYERMRNRLADLDLKVVFTGHIHTSDIARDWNEAKEKEIYDVNTGSLISYPCDYREVTLSNDLSKMSITTAHISTLEGTDNFADYAKGRLKTAIENIVTARGAVYAVAAPTVADAFIVHAEGNEPENKNSADLLSKLETAANMAKLWGKLTEEECTALKMMANSMMQDKSNYNTDREDVTNDLTLDIELTAPETGTGIDASKAERLQADDSWFDLQGRKHSGSPAPGRLGIKPTQRGVIAF